MRVLFVCGTLNQTTQMHAIARELSDVDCWFTPFYATGSYGWAQQVGLLDFTAIFNPKSQAAARGFLEQNGVAIDDRGSRGGYDLALLCTDLLIPSNLLHTPKILIQEGMTDPEGWTFRLVKRFQRLGAPLWLARTSTTGLSDEYESFCVASDGYRDHFIRKGVRPEKIVVTGIPNFDDVQAYRLNGIPYRDYVLIATSDIRENFGIDRRTDYLLKVKSEIGDLPAVYKPHPNERRPRCIDEFRSVFPRGVVLADENPHHLIANCAVLYTQYSTLAFTGLALGKKVHSYFDVEALARLTPLQNDGRSAAEIAKVCRRFLKRRARASTRPSPRAKALMLKSVSS